MADERLPQERKSGNTFFGGMAILTLGIVVVKLIGMFYKIPLGNIIGEQGYADFQNAYNIYAILIAISTTGLPVAVSKMVSEASTLKHHGEVKEIFSVSLKFFLFLGGISFFIMFFFSEQLAELLNDTHAAPSIRALAPAVVFVSGVAALRGYFQGQGYMTPTAVSQIIEALSKLILGLSLAYYFMNQSFTTEDLEEYLGSEAFQALPTDEIDNTIEGILASEAAAGAIMGVTVGTAMALGFLVLRFVWGGGFPRKKKGEMPSSQKEIMGRLLAIAIPITITSSMSGIITLIDATLVQGQLQGALGMSENESRILYGNYAWALNIYNLPLSLVTAVTISVIPAVTAALAQKQRKKAAEISISSLRMTALLAIPMGAGLFVLGEPIIMLLYPNADLQLSGQLLSSLGFVAPFVCFSLVCTSIMQVYGFFYLPILITIAGGVIKVIANYILVGQEGIGIYGAPMGNLFCFSFCFFVSISVLLRVIPGLSRNLSMFIKPLIAATVMGGGAWASYGFCSGLMVSSTAFAGETLGSISGTGNAVCVLLSIVVAVVIYLSLVLILGAVEESDILMMPKGEKLLRIIQKKRGRR
ncbi:MAG: oligosaccharide flippase family protein [Eubacteriales bacterium]